jgi:peptidyl-prolyl cis-trans isomerase A (cyclophilin A)
MKVRVVFAVLALAACSKTQPELAPDPAPAPSPKPSVMASAASSATTTSSDSDDDTAPGPAPTSSGGKTGGDPLKGKFSLADATKDLKGSGPIVATIDTAKGKIQCKLLDDKAPNTVANFIGLATGKRAWRDPKSGTWVNKPAYDGTTFHRIIKGFMIQGGDPNGNGSGEPGYVIPDELWTGSKHDHAGQLCMANRGHDTNGAQFFITDAAAAHLDGNYTIFGECAPVETVHALADSPVKGDQAVSPPAIKTVTISRDEKKSK